MNRKTIVPLVAVLVMVLIGTSLGGCSLVGQTVGTGINPVPVLPSTTISESDAWRSINFLISNAGAMIGVERACYNSVPLARIQNTADQLVLDPRWDQHTACEAFIVQMKRGDPDAAVGLALLGPPNDARYWVIALDALNGGILIRQIDPVGQRIFDWNQCQPAGFICM